jgi:trans-aconitate 2-methyltransferase
MVTQDWDPAYYLAFKQERALPARDLLARVPGFIPGGVVDLGCGPGNSTALLRQAYPGAQLVGIDSSPAMLVEATKAVPDATFTCSSVEQWSPGPAVDLVFSNALFQWLANHAMEMRRIFSALKSGAVLAVQMPDNLGEPSHVLMRELAMSGQWAGPLRAAAEARQALLAVEGYHDLLSPLAARLEIWRTTYLHHLPSHQAIADMLSSTGLKPFLDALDDAGKEAFLAAYVAGLRMQYPTLAAGGVLYPFPRLFLVAVRM